MIPVKSGPDVSYTCSQASTVLDRIKSKNGNSRCAMCSTVNPTWASVTFGIFLCNLCSGRHRSFGTGVSFVRSCTLDNWSSSQLKHMELGGNQEFLKQVGLPNRGISTLTHLQSDTAKRYKSQLFTQVTNAFSSTSDFSSDSSSDTQQITGVEEESTTQSSIPKKNSASEIFQELENQSDIDVTTSADSFWDAFSSLDAPKT